ncbi:MAG: hypothetical protein JRE40_01095 [Deltaproteobacteria bacterium]|nr:hypothetical protein [Deltaproteobacteria bacterium]
MTVLAASDRLAVGDLATRKILIGSDTFISQRGGGWYGTSSSVMRLNHRLEPIWSRSYFSESTDPDFYGTSIRGRECVLSADGRYLYVAGDGGNYNLLKLDATDGSIIWQKLDGDPYARYIALDSDENVIVFTVDASTETIGVLKKYTSAGSLVWPGTKSIGGVTGIACDSDGYIYVTVSSDFSHTPATSAGLHKIHPTTGATIWSATVPHALNDVAINAANDIFVIGWTETVDLVDCQVFKYAPESNTRLDAVPAGDAGNPDDNNQRLVCDSLGNLIALNMTSTAPTLVKFTAGLAEVWSFNYTGFIGPRQIDCDVHNRVHVFGPHSLGLTYAYRIHDAGDGSVVFQNSRPGGGTMINGIACSPDVYLGEYTDQVSNLVRPDMCCFMDATKIKLDYDDATLEGVVKWHYEQRLYDLQYHFTRPPDNWHGMFRARRNLPAFSDYLLGNDAQLEMLSRTPSCENPNWNAYNGFGGIGSAPQIYTVTFTGMLKVSDSSPSPYNGEYLLIKGPGLMGFFYRYEHDELIKINFTVEDVYLDLQGYIDDDNGWMLIGDRDEKITFTVGSDEGNVFTYSTSSNHNEKLTAAANDNTILTANAIAYGGSVSIYPGQVAQWDAVTTWPAAAIVAWAGRFYQANNENSNSEPPSGDWAVI